MGGRTLKSGQSRWFVGYKKHSFRLWWRPYEKAVLLLPLVSWVAPANVYEGAFLVPSLRHCDRRWSWWPRYVVADMGYVSAQRKKQCRETWRVAVLTHLRADINLCAPFQSERQALCPQGEPLRWLGYDPQDQQHWFTVSEHPELCRWCWEARQCPRQFAYSAARHETLLGLLPLSTRPAQRLLKQVRSWIEPSQSYEKIQLGLGRMFLNSLRFTWCMALLADAVALLRAHALLRNPSEPALLRELAPSQRELNLAED